MKVLFTLLFCLVIQLNMLAQKPKAIVDIKFDLIHLQIANKKRVGEKEHKQKTETYLQARMMDQILAAI